MQRLRRWVKDNNVPGSHDGVPIGLDRGQYDVRESVVEVKDLEVGTMLWKEKSGELSGVCRGSEGRKMSVLINKFQKEKGVCCQAFQTKAAFSGRPYTANRLPSQSSGRATKANAKLPLLLINQRVLRAYANSIKERIETCRVLYV